MSACTFFGHRDCYGLDRDSLIRTIEDLIGRGVDTFYVGHQGQFDGMVSGVLRQLSAKYPHICYQIVLAYLPVQKQEFWEESNTLYPEGLENCPPRFAITRRNKWMLNNAEYCVCYIRHTWGGAYPFAKEAKKKGKTVINLAEMEI